MGDKNKKTVGKSTTGGIGGGKTTGGMNLSTIASKFDGLKAEANKLPDGKEKNTLLEKMEEAYVSIAHGFSQLIGGVSHSA